MLKKITYIISWFLLAVLFLGSTTDISNSHQFDYFFEGTSNPDDDDDCNYPEMYDINHDLTI